MLSNMGNKFAEFPIVVVGVFNEWILKDIKSWVETEHECGGNDPSFVYLYSKPIEIIHERKEAIDILCRAWGKLDIKPHITLTQANNYNLDIKQLFSSKLSAERLHYLLHSGFYPLDFSIDTYEFFTGKRDFDLTQHIKLDWEPDPLIGIFILAKNEVG